MLQPGHCVLKCQGKDLTRRGAKAKGARLMVVLPAQLAVKQSTEGTLGVIEKANTECPELVVKTSKVHLSCYIMLKTILFQPLLTSYHLRVRCGIQDDLCLHQQHTFH